MDRLSWHRKSFGMKGIEGALGGHQFRPGVAVSKDEQLIKATSLQSLWQPSGRDCVARTTAWCSLDKTAPFHHTVIRREPPDDEMALILATIPSRPGD
jgi:hypothetical protein